MIYLYSFVINNIFIILKQNILIVSDIFNIILASFSLSKTVKNKQKLSTKALKTVSLFFFSNKRSPIFWWSCKLLFSIGQYIQFPKYKQSPAKMYQETTLKRNRLADSIRSDQREKIRKQMRYKFNQSVQQQMIQQAYNDEQFKKMKYECRSNNFQIGFVQKTIQYLAKKNIYHGLSQEINIKFVDEVLIKIGNNDDQRMVAVREMIKRKLMQLLEIQLENSPKDEKGNISPTKQFSDLNILRNCFDSFIFLLQNHRCLGQLWVPFSQLRNRSLKSYSFQNFEQFLVYHIDSLTSEQITIIALGLYNYLQDCQSQTYKFLTIMDLLYTKYNIRPFDNIRLIECLIQILTTNSNNSQNIVKIIVQDTRIVENVTACLDKSCDNGWKHCFQLVAKIAEFVGKLYSIEDQKTCQQIYLKNLMILGHIRSWLPVAPNIQVHMLQHIGNGSLLHSNHKCTIYLIFALTNIVVSDPCFIETMLIKSDIYRALVYLYKLVPMGCREEIAIFMRNMVHKCDTGSLRVMLETKLPEILTQMLKETSSSINVCALSIVKVIAKSLQEDYNHAMSQFLYTRRRFQIALENLGAIKLIDSLVHSPENEVVDKALAALQLLN